MTHAQRLFLIPALLFAHSALARITGDTYFDDKTGFSISKIRGWEFSNKKKSYGLQLKEDKMTSPDSDTLVTLSKEMGDGFLGVPPSVGVQILKIRTGSDLLKWLNDEMERQKEHDKYFVQASAPMPMTIGGKKGASTAYVNSTAIKGQEVHVYHALYVVAAGSKVYLIHMNCNEAISNLNVEAFSKIAGTIKTSQDD
jgi:hypothetical protein